MNTSKLTFLSLPNYRNKEGELANYRIIFRISYKNCLIGSIRELHNIEVSDPFAIQAKEELLLSFQRSLDKIEETGIEDLDDGYNRLYENDGTYIKGIKQHIRSGDTYVYGLVVKKSVIEPVNYPVINSSPKTIAKNALRRQLPIGLYRQFKISPEQVGKITTDGKNFVIN